MDTHISTEEFSVEARRRLIDMFDLKVLLGLRSTATIWKRVEAGALPEPLLREQTYTLWDRDAIPTEGSTE